HRPGDGDGSPRTGPPREGGRRPRPGRGEHASLRGTDSPGRISGNRGGKSGQDPQRPGCSEGGPHNPRKRTRGGGGSPSKRGDESGGGATDLADDPAVRAGPAEGPAGRIRARGCLGASLVGGSADADRTARARTVREGRESPD